MAKKYEAGEKAEDPVLAAILDELRAIRMALEHPKQTALNEFRETVTT